MSATPKVTQPERLVDAGGRSGPLHLILGGARSGKSRFAQAQAQAQRWPVCYLATATPSDGEMAARIAHHRATRPATWQTIEVPYRLGEAIAASRTAGYAVLVDCLTLWCSNWLLWVEQQWVPAEAEAPLAGADAHQRAQAWQEAVATLLAVCRTVAAEPHAPPVWLVANEVGLGIVPSDPLSRRFRDEAGHLNQQLAAIASAVTFVIAGIPWSIKRPLS